MPRRPENEPRKHPRQRRARETVRALVEAAARILETDGLAALTTNRVAERAGVAVGSLYQYFPSKGAIVGAVIEARLDDDVRFVRALLADRSAPLRVRAPRLVDALCDRQRAGASLMAALLGALSEVERDDLARRTFAGLLGELRAALAAEPADLRPDLRDPEALDVALFVVGRALRWSTNEAILERPALLDDPRFRAELRRVVSGLFA